MTLMPGIRPPRLREGDRIAVVAPSGPVPPERMAAGVTVLRELGLDVEIGAHALDSAGYLAGSDAGRAADLQAAWCDPAVRAVVCARGGYGAARLLDHLDWRALAAAVAGGRPPLLHGFSDVTALHAAFGAHLGVVSTFGPMAAGATLAEGNPDPLSLDHLAGTLFTPERTRVITAPSARALAGGRATGVLTGGTLSLLASSIGTRYAAAPATGGILLLEEVAEQPYRVDRMLTQLAHAGYLDGLAGLVLGSWADCGPPADIERVLAELLLPLGVPVLTDIPVGHGDPQLTVPLLAEAELDADAGTVTLTHPALA